MYLNNPHILSTRLVLIFNKEEEEEEKVAEESI